MPFATAAGLADVVRRARQSAAPGLLCLRHPARLV